MYDQSTIEQHHEPPAGGYPVAPDRSRGVFVVVGLGLVAVLGLAAGLLVLHSRSSAPTFTQASAARPAPVPTSVAASDGTAAPTGGDPSSSVIPAGDAGAPLAVGETGGAPALPTPTAPHVPTGPAAPASPAAPAGPAPAVISFHTPDNIDCHNGNQQTFSASWTTTNATKTAIAIDGAPYQTFGPNADVSLPFNCARPHSFTLTATAANGKIATKTITLQPRNVQPPQTDDGGDTPTPQGPVATIPQGAKPQQ